MLAEWQSLACCTGTNSQQHMCAPQYTLRVWESLSALSLTPVAPFPAPPCCLLCTAAQAQAQAQSQSFGGKLPHFMALTRPAIRCMRKHESGCTVCVFVIVACYNSTIQFPGRQAPCASECNTLQAAHIRITSQLTAASGMLSGQHMSTNNIPTQSPFCLPICCCCC